MTQEVEQVVEKAAEVVKETPLLMRPQDWATEAQNGIGTYAPGVLVGIVVLIIGNWVIGKIVKGIDGLLKRANVDQTLATFLEDMAAALMRIALAITAIGIMGVDTTKIVTIISALLIGISMAMNGTIGHIASGVMLMIFKPFKIGDIVKIGGNQTAGKVDAISAFNTILKTLDNQKIIIANTNVINNDITNISGQGIVGVELTFGIGYDDDIKKAKEIILKVGASCPHILKDPAQGVVVAELADSSVNLATRPFCNSEHYWDVLFYMQENVKLAFDEAGISIPYPQMDVHTKG